MIIFPLDRFENNVGKGKNAGYQHSVCSRKGMAFFSTFFSKIPPIFKNDGEIFYIEKEGQMPTISKFYQFTTKFPLTF